MILNLVDRGVRKIFRRKFIFNFDKFCKAKKGYALLYYKTDPFIFPWIKKGYSHTNLWECYEMAKILNQNGYIVDIVDRTINKKDLNKIKNKYDLFLGLGAGDSGKFYKNIAEKLTGAIRIMLAFGPEPNFSNKITKERHDFFLERHPGEDIVVRRLIKEVDIDESMEFTDAIFTNCNDWGIEGYKKFRKPIYRLWLSSHPNLYTSMQEILNKDQKKFLYFGGNGNITKGLDLVIESFSKCPELELYIGAPKTELDFNKVMQPILDKSPNIHFIGFMNVGGKEFSEISAKCGYVILASSSEGCATSVTTCMRRGLIPVVTEASGIDVKDFGYMIESISIDDMMNTFFKVSSIQKEEFINRSIGAYMDSFNFTQENFRATFEKSLFHTIYNNKM